MKRFLRSPWYFLLVAAYPVLALLSYNISQVRASIGLRPLVVVLLVAALLFQLFRLIYRQSQRAAFATSAVLILFFTYGQLYDQLATEWQLSFSPLWMLAGWLVLTGLALAWAGRCNTRFEKATPWLNLLSLLLVLVSAVQIAWWSWPQSAHLPVDDFAPLQSLSVPDGQDLPDIYYIIVDSYGRSDLLWQSFSFDNSGFIHSLQAMGFFVAGCSQSNYNRTDVSLASSLNLEYLQNLDENYRPGNLGRSTLWESISHSTARYELENLGYKTVAFATGFTWTEIEDAEVFLSPSWAWSQMTGFETLLIRTTPARHLEDLGWINLDQIDGQRYRERTQLILSSMDELARMPGPKFVFIHLIPPHPPFVYAPDGSPTNPAPFLNEDRRYTIDTYTQGYRNQVAYISSQLLPALQTLISASARPPIIVLQGDHAPWLQNGYRTFLILNAYYLPGQEDKLYPTISPVNTFRLIFDLYFGADYELLPDISYYSPVPNIYEFVQTPNPCIP